MLAIANRPTLDPTAASYDEIWGKTEEFSAPSHDITSHCYLNGISNNNIHIIDVASGNGRYAVYFNQQGYRHVTALEMSKTGCDVISARASNPENISVINADILEWSPNTQYSIVVCSGLLEEFNSSADQITAVKKLQEMTANGGKLILRHCLYISSNEPQERVSKDLVASLFATDQWHTEKFETDETPRKYTTPEGACHFIQRQTLVAKKRVQALDFSP